MTGADPTDPSKDLTTVSVSGVNTDNSALTDSSATDALQNVMALPAVGLIDVQGSIDAGTSPATFKVPLSGYPSMIELRLTSARPDQPINENLRVLDPSMKELASTSPTATSHSLYIRLIVTNPSESALFARIALLDSAKLGNDANTSSFPYLLEIARTPLPQLLGPPSSNYSPDSSPAVYYEDDGRDSTFDSSNRVVITLPIQSSTIGTAPSDLGTPANPPPPPTSPPPTAPSPPPTGLPTGPESTWGAPSSSSQGSGHPAQTPIGSAVALLPVRSAAPIGGVFGMADPVPLVDPNPSIPTDLAQFDPARDPGEGNLPAHRLVPVGVEHAVPNAEQAVVLRGPGGLPLLATALLAGPVGSRSKPADPMNDPETDDPAEPGVVLAPLVSSHCTSETSPVLASANPSAQETPPRVRRGRRATILPGVAVAFALGSGLMLPDIAAAFPFARRPRTRLRIGLIRRALRRSLSRT